jgi:hypothetical protein
VGIVVRFAIRATLVVLALAAPPSFAGAGWYLLVPPTSEYDERAAFLSGIKILSAQPLSKWSQQGAYDSASECEEVRNALTATAQNLYSRNSADYIKAVGANEKPYLLKHMRWTTERSNANVDALIASRCVESNDPRLRK